MKVLFVLPRMVMGGVERVTLNLIRQLQAEGIQCALALRRCHGELLTEAMHLTAVHEVAGGGLHQFVPRLAKLMREWQPTHVIVAFADVGLLTLWARKRAGCNAVVVCGVHNSHGIETARAGAWGRMRYKIDGCVASVVYRHVDAIVTSSMDVEAEIRTLFGVSADRVHTIHNPVITTEDSHKLSSRSIHSSSGALRIVALGRLTRQKGFDVLIDAMAKIANRHDWHLDIYGDGPDRVALEAQVEDLQLSSRISLKGYISDPIGCLRSADIFVLSSRHEGLPTVLILALACGLKIVSTDCPHGPREILHDGRLGVLVPPEDPCALAGGISRVLLGQFEIDQARLRARAQDFTVASSAARWRELLERVTSVSA